MAEADNFIRSDGINNEQDDSTIKPVETTKKTEDIIRNHENSNLLEHSESEKQ